VRTPPPVSIDLPPERGWCGFQAALHGVAATALVAWLASHAGWADGGWTLALPLGATVATLLWIPFVQPPARLRRSGAQWTWQARGGPEITVPAPAVMMDLGPWMLLRVRPPGAGAEWRAATRRQTPADWLPFRAAVYSTAPVTRPRSDPERPPS
jgi:hypothetical protein